MPPPGRDLDRLYQLPLAEFTSARDDLAKHAGPDRAAIRALQKPNLPAWAVNQLYWRERRTYDALVAAAERLRAAQLAALEGRRADVPRAEAEHVGARKNALDRTRKILADAGERASAATLHALAETLDALPGPEPPGRLTKPLKPAGFDALAGLLGGGGRKATGAAVLPFTRAPESRTAAASDAAARRTARQEAAHADAQAKREARAREAEFRTLREALKSAREAARAAEAALRQGRAALAKAERDLTQVKARVSAAEARAAEWTRKVEHRAVAASAAAARRAELERRLAQRGG